MSRWTSRTVRTVSAGFGPFFPVDSALGPPLASVIRARLISYPFSRCVREGPSTASFMLRSSLASNDVISARSTKPSVSRGIQQGVFRSSPLMKHYSIITSRVCQRGMVQPRCLDQTRRVQECGGVISNTGRQQMRVQQFRISASHIVAEDGHATKMTATGIACSSVLGSQPRRSSYRHSFFLLLALGSGRGTHRSLQVPFM